MNKAKVLITPRVSFGKFPQAEELLRKNDIEPVFPPHPHPLTEDQLLELIAPFDALIFGLEPLTERVFEKAKNLKVVSKHGVGVDNVDIEAATNEVLWLLMRQAPTKMQWLSWLLVFCFFLPVTLFSYTKACKKTMRKNGGNRA